MGCALPEGCGGVAVLGGKCARSRNSGWASQTGGRLARSGGRNRTCARSRSFIFWKRRGELRSTSKWDAVWNKLKR